jgi:glycerol-3-phosphate dehydrogenase (NAD(P)+)
MSVKFAVLGDGAWGTAISILLAQQAHRRVVLWSAFQENHRLLVDRRENIRLLPGVKIPESIELTTDAAAAIQGAEMAISAIPTVYLRATLQRFRGVWPTALPTVSLSKGLENDTFLRPSQILHDVLGLTEIAALSGPSHAEEVSRGRPTSVVVASEDEALGIAVQNVFNSDRFRVYTNRDIIGVELAGAVKNVIGIAAGACDGLKFGDNAKSALMTRALVEIARFGVAHGADHATFMGLAGLGDLITTCISPHGRNRRVGERLGQGEKLADILATMPQVAEGVYTTRSVYFRAKAMGVDLPIMTEVYRVLYEGKAPLDGVADLMLRSPKKE